jgi:hypothetical protein
MGIMPKTKIPGILVIHRHNLLPTASMVMEIVEAFPRHSRFKAWSVNTHLGFPDVLRDLDFEVIVLHYSLFAHLPFVEDEFRAYLAENVSSYKVAFFQDEYRFWPERAEVLNRFKVDCVYTCLEPDYYEETYGKYTWVPRLETYLPGYVSDEMLQRAQAERKPDGDRTVDIGYRGRLSPEFIYLGTGALEKYEIALRFREKATGLGFVLDIETEENKRIYGNQWLAFLGNCRAVLGVEAGVSIFDIDNEIIPRYERFREEHPGLNYEQVYEQLLAQIDGKGVYYRTLSPRAFEAAAVGACQILYEGRYSGILEPMVHYIPLKKDFSNFDDVIRLFRDADVRRELTENCHRDLIASGAYSYRRFIEKFDEDLIEAGLEPRMSEQMARRVTERLKEGVAPLVIRKVGTQRVEYQELMTKHLALQVQYMKQQELLQEMLDPNKLSFTKGLSIGLSIATLYVGNMLRHYPAIHKMAHSTKLTCQKYCSLIKNITK